MIVSTLLVAGTLGRIPFCTNTTSSSTSLVNEVDFLFLIDASGSMDNKIRGVESGFNAFAAMINRTNISAQFAAVRFGGTPAIFLPFTNRTSDLATAVSRIRTTGTGGQEAGLEAIRASLPPENGNYMTKSCQGVYTSRCTLNWRPNALKVMILATDENSDLPTLARYRMPGQNGSISFCWAPWANNVCTSGIEPPFLPRTIMRDTSGNNNYYRTAQPMRMPTPYEEEIRATAQVLLDQGVYMNVLMSLQAWGGEAIAKFDNTNLFWRQAFANVTLAQRPSDGTIVSAYQYGDFNQAVQFANYSGFNRAATLQRLTTANLSNSLNARVLASGGFIRLFNVERFISGVDTAMVSAFYTQLVRTTISISQSCSFPEEAQASTPVIDTFVPPPQANPDSVGDSPDVPVVVVESSESTEPSTTSGSDQEITDILSSVTNSIVNGFNEVTKSETNVASMIGGVSFAAVASVFLVVPARKRKEIKMALFGGRFIDADANLTGNPLYETHGTQENPLYEKANSVPNLSVINSNLSAPMSPV